MLHARLRRKTAFLTILILLAIGGCGSAERSVTLLITGDMLGNIEPCG